MLIRNIDERRLFEKGAEPTYFVKPGPSLLVAETEASTPHDSQPGRFECLSVFPGLQFSTRFSTFCVFISDVIFVSFQLTGNRKSLIENALWCRWWDLNPHDFLRSQDFKSCASAISPHRQLSLKATFASSRRVRLSLCYLLYHCRVLKSPATKSGEASGKQLQSHLPRFAKVLDWRKQPIRTPETERMQEDASCEKKASNGTCPLLDSRNWESKKKGPDFSGPLRQFRSAALYCCAL